MLPSLLLLPALFAVEDGTLSVPIAVEAVATPMTDAGTFTLRLILDAEEDLDERYDMRVALDVGEEDYLVTEVALKPPTTKWKQGDSHSMEIDLAVPPEMDLGESAALGVLIGFVEEGTDELKPPAGAPLGTRDYGDILFFEVPRYAGEAGAARLEATIEEAAALKAAGDAPGAWAVLEDGLRSCADDENKERFRDELLDVGRFDAAPISPIEQGIVEERIRAEKVRYFRLIAGRMWGRGELHGALRLLEEAGGSLAESVDEAVIGAVDDEQRVTRDIEDIEERLVTQLSKEEEARAKSLETRFGLTKELLDEAERLISAKEWPVGLQLLRRLRYSEDEETEDRARERIPEVEEEYVAWTPPDQMAKVRAATQHPAWARTSTSQSHRFIYIGPEELVANIPRDSRLLFDVVYVFITDLFGRVPNPGGDRITVYFKELWDFGGGVGGGKIIDIGKASPSPPRPVRVDTGLFYHELTHCVDDTSPVFAGFTEGLANLGAAFGFEMLDQDADAENSFEDNLEQFQEYFLARDLEYWRIQEYGPSAGFFLHFIDTYSKRGRAQHDWAPLRRFFREYREAPVRDGREPYIARSIGHYLTRAFGPQVFDDLMWWGFPFIEADRRALARELLAFDESDLEPFEGAYEEFPGSPLPRDVLGRELSRQARWDSDEVEALREELGVVYDFKVIGPFYAQRADPGAHPFEPERSIDFKKKPRTLRPRKDDHTQLVWQNPMPVDVSPEAHFNVRLHPSGWLRFDYKPYGDDNSAIYALTNVTVDEAVDAMAHVRADDDVTLFVNGRRIVAYKSRGRNGSSDWVAWRGPFEDAPDGMRFPVRLEAGRNRVLVKIRNRGGVAGMTIAFSKPDGSKLEFETDAEQPDELEAEKEPTWRRVVRLDHRSYKSKTKVEVGGFRTRNKAFHGADTDGGVPWRLFTVRPGFPKDSPSNLLWLKDNLTDDLVDLKLELELVPSNRAPKLLLTFQGEGKKDGLSGWNAILLPSGRDRVMARLERYDRLVYQSDPVDLAEVEEVRRLVLTVAHEACTLTLDGVALLDAVPITPIPEQHRVGLATWGQDPKIQSLELSKGKRR